MKRDLVDLMTKELQMKKKTKDEDVTKYLADYIPV